MTLTVTSREYNDDPAEMDTEGCYTSPEEDAAISDEENRRLAEGYSDQEWSVMLAEAEADDNGEELPDPDCCPENLVCESVEEDTFDENRDCIIENEVNRKIKVQGTFLSDFLNQEVEAALDERRKKYDADNPNDISMEDVLGIGVKTQETY